MQASGAPLLHHAWRCGAKALRAAAVEVIECVFYIRWMPRAEQDRLMLARIAGVTRRHAGGGPMTGEQKAAALAELAGVTEGRMDLLSEHAGVLLGSHANDIDAADE